jgi:predicted esterase
MMLRRIVLTVSIALLMAPLAAAADVKQKEPGPKSKGKQYEWKAKDGLVYRYFVPKSYGEEKGANLTLILHGSNLDRRWGFANHKAGGVRPDDVVVSPDGTTPNGRGGYNFLGEGKDAKRLNALLKELRKLVKVRNVYLYGHSQGSFFALYYAGQYPDDIAGVVAHASGVWTWTQQGPAGHHQAIVLMHGTQDPVVPYPQSVGGFQSYRDARYPTVRLRSLENWNHWPAEHNGPIPHTSQQLAWCEGMTTEDPERLEACFELLRENKKKERHDYAGLYSLAKRIEGLDDAPEQLKARAAKAAAAVEKLAADHVDALSLPEKIEFDGKPWTVHLVVFLRSFIGVPAREELAEKLEKTLDQHQKTAIKHLRVYYRQRQKKPAEAFSAGLSAIQKGFLYHECAGRDFLGQLETWSKKARDHRLGKKALRQFQETVPAYRKALEEGYREFDAVNRKVGKL